MRRPGTFVLAGALLFVLASAGCGGSSKSANTTTSTAPKKNGCVVVTSPPAFGAHREKRPTAPLPVNKVYDVTMVTNCGSFTIRIDQKQSPNAAASFVSLVQRGFYNNTIFHRIVPGFVIQGGDPTGSGNGGPGYTTVDKPPAKAAYTHGVVAMAKTSSQPNGAAGSQFFIVTVPDAGLPPQYAIIGKVSSGLAVVDHIGTFGNSADPAGTPTQTVEVEQASVKVS
ncbi:MAG TPA: peptidylprolyl isomerase [Gaiellaceae bacterium]|jgi:cyclophilin family peptidyl-prolyl cis-trans isomerase|nr:peptidylprolyl isomerase [Gaiellaceae bacterium]